MTIILSSTASSDVGIANYCDLVSQIQDWLNRTDLDAQIPEFVRLAESRIRTDFRLRAQETVASDVLVDGEFTLPENFNEARTLLAGDQELTYLSPLQYSRMERLQTSSVLYYTIVGNTVKVLAGTDDDYTLTYWARFDYFGACEDTNWLLLNSPDVYLWASLEAGYLFLKDGDAADVCSARYDRAKERVQSRDEQSRHSGPLVIPAEGCTP